MAHHSAPSPAASTASGTTTIPNTPRSDHEPSGLLGEAQAHASSPRLGDDESYTGNQTHDLDTSSSSSGASRRRMADIQPTWPRKVDQTKTKALVCWQPDRRLENIFLDIHWAPRGKTGGAFFKLHTGLRFEGAPSSRRDGRVSAYIFIYPERIRQLSFDAQPQEKPFGANTTALSFEMHMPSALVLPKTYSGVGHEAEEVDRSLRELARQTSFTVYAALPRRKLPGAWVQQLCAAVTGQRLSTIAACANIANFYQGQGAQLLEGDSIPEPSPSRDKSLVQSKPPAYEDAGPSPPPAASTKGKKRRRRSSSASTREADVKPVDCAALESLLDARIDARLAAHMSDVAEMHAAHRAEVAELLSAHKSGIVELITALKTELADKLDDSETRVRDDVVDGLMELITDKVQEGLGDVEDRVMDKITSMPLQATLTFPGHHMY